MSPDVDPEESPPEARQGKTRADTEKQRAARRRRLAAALGDPLPEGTRDETGEGWGERDADSGGEEWLRNQVPPHHG